MGERIRAKDWSKTPLGDPSTWPQSLCTLVGVMLENPFGMYVAWGKDYIQLYNDGYRPILGATKHPHALGSSARDSFPEIWHIIGPMMAKVLQGKAVSFTDYKLPLNRYGFLEECYFDFSYSPIRNDDGKVGGVLATVVETTGKRRAEEDLKESNDRFRSTMKQAPVGMAILRGHEYIVEMANEAYLQLVDCKESELIGRPLFEALPMVKDTVETLLDGVLNEGIPYHGKELPVPLLRNGKHDIFYFDFIYHPLREHGTLSGVIVVVTEVSEKVATRKKIEQKKRLYETITQNTPDHIYVYDLEYRFSYINEALLRTWGRPLEESIGKTMLEVGFEPWQADRHEREIDQVIATKKPVRGEVAFPHATLGMRIYDYIFVPVIDAQGHVEAVAGTTRDITQQVEQRKLLEESKELFSSFGNNIHNLAWIAEGDGNIFWYNQRWLDYTGLSLEEMKGKGWQKVHHPDHIDRIMAIDDKLWSTNEPFELTFPLRRHDGVYRWFLTWGVPVTDDHGNIVRWIGTNTDITEQKEIQDLLQESETRYRSLADNIPMITFIIEPDAQATVSYWNKTWLDYTGQTYKNALGRGWDGLIHPDDLQSVIDIYLPHFAKREAIYIPAIRVKRYDGVYRWHLFTANPRYLQTGEFMGYIGVGLDIHNQKVAEEVLKESEERFRSLAQTLPQLVWVTDAQGNAEFASARWKEYTGIEPIADNVMAAIVHPDDLEGVTAAWSASLSSGTLYRYDVRLKNKNGEYRWFTVKGEPVFDQAHHIVKWVGAFTDIHEQKINEEKKDEFISIASHELKTPLTTAKAYLQMLDISLDKSQQEAGLYASKAIKAVNRLNELIGELLDVSKIRLGKLNYNISTFNFNELMNYTVESVQLTSPTHTITKTGEVCAEVTGDMHRLQQVIINLLSNAIKYSPRAHEVFIHMEQKNGCITVAVRDQGIGIDKHNLDRIFEKYHRVEEHAVNFQGLGVGLYICYEIIQRHMGRLWAESEPGKGSTFYFTLPVCYSSVRSINT